MEWPGDRIAAADFEARIAWVSSNALIRYPMLPEWTARRQELHRQAAEMLGLDPPPERSDLRMIVTGVLTQGQVVVETLHFQPVPGLIHRRPLLSALRPRQPRASDPVLVRT